MGLMGSHRNTASSSNVHTSKIDTKKLSLEESYKKYSEKLKVRALRA